MQQLRRMSVGGLIAVLLMLGFARTAYGDTWYVNAAASGGDGTTWGEAFRYLQDALEATPGGGSDEIWVAQGTYYPPDGLESPPNDEREASFELQGGVAIYGGFVGGETLLTQRNPERNATILSGDLGDLGETSDNSFHVVTATSVSGTAVLNGFTITQGVSAGQGGGMLVENANPTVVHCIFLANGGPSAGYGGGVAINTPPNGSTMYVVNCSFLGNRTGGHAGGVFLHSDTTDATVEFHNCVFSGNVANTHGGAFCNHGVSVRLKNCTLSRNDGGNVAGAFAVFSDAELDNCIVWANVPTPQVLDSEDLASVYFSDFEGGWDGAGSNNIDDDPLFCDAAGPDDEPGTTDDNVRLEDGSPCIDTGDDSSVPDDVADVDDDGNTEETLPWDRDNEKPLSQWGRFFDVASGPGSSVDMGAYENQHIADCPWDISSSGYTAPPDGDVGNPDFLMLIAEWGSCPGCGADFSCDGSVSTVDYNELLANWGSCPGGGDGPQGGGDSSLEEALEAMGFYDLADYQTWLSGAADEEAYASAVELALLLGE